MINFAVGPVQSNQSVLNIGSEQVPYFRTDEFSAVMLENERLMLKFAKAPEEARAVFITGSGTASMEAVVINTLDEHDKALVINGGSFGQRFVDILALHNVPFEEIKLEIGEDITEAILQPYSNQGFTTLLVNVHETSTGVHYDIDLISKFCRKNKLFLIVDAISSFLADPFDMGALGAGVMITGSQKALACPPGVSIILLDTNALQRVEKHKSKCMYLDLQSALVNQNRGQTPFTPAVSILLQINARLKQIDSNGGAEAEIKKTQELACYFRSRIKSYPFEIVTNSMSNAVTSLHPTTQTAYKIFTVLKEEYGIWVCPNGASLRDIIFRVGHIGELSKNDYDKLIAAFDGLQKRGII